jgi:hypothetical protein
MNRISMRGALPICVFTLLALLVLTLTPSAIAQGGGNPHFIKNATSASLVGSSLQCSFKETGLSTGSTETVTCTADELITYECVNGGGRNPSASNKKTTKTTGSASGNFTADQNGNIIGSLTISPTAASNLDPPFSCPSGQTVTLVSVTYSNIKITDGTSGASISIPGTFTFTDPTAPTPR